MAALHEIPWGAHVKANQERCGRGMYHNTKG